MTGLLHDIRYAARRLRKSPGLTAAAVVTLALGIGANTAVFSVIEAVLLRSLPYKEPSQLLILSDASDPDPHGGAEGGILYKDYQAWKAATRSFQDVALYYRNSGWSQVTINDNEPESVQGAFVSANFFPLLGIPPVLGRWFTRDEELNRDHVIVLSHSLWVRRFGAARDVLGKTLPINAANAQIIGVMPESFQVPAKNAQFWAPITINSHWGDPELARIDPQHGRGFYARWKAIGRLRPGTTFSQAQAEARAISARLKVSDPDPNRSDLGLFCLHADVAASTRLAFSVLAGAVFLVLLITCINIANMLLARGVAREHELALRTSLGASRHRLVRQLFAESLLLTAFAASLGIGLARFGVRALVNFAPQNIPRLEDSGVDATVLVFTVVVSALSAVLFGLIPAWKTCRTEPARSLKTGAAAGSAPMAIRQTHGLLVATQFALSVVLLTGAGLLMHSYLAIEAVNPGFEVEHAMTLKIVIPWGTSSQRARALHESVLQRVSDIPGVKAVGGVDGLFELGSLSNLGLRAIEGRAPEPIANWTPLIWDTVSGDYFEAMGIPLLRGRYFSEQDRADSSRVVVIDEDMARRYWPNQDPVGQRIKGQDRRGANDDWVTVIGVVGNVRNHGLEMPSTPHVYEWYAQSGEVPADVVVRTTNAPNAFIPTLRAAVRAIDRGLIIGAIATMNEQLSEQLSPRRFQTSVLGLFALIAVLLACSGIYGVMQYSVSQRIPEMGIRMVLGASRRDLTKMVIGQGLVLASVGIAPGLIVALLMSHYLQALLYDVRPTDPLTIVMVVSIMSATALLACYLPARRAGKVEPMVALRYE